MNYKSLIKKIVKQSLLEIKQQELSDVEVCHYAHTHSLQTCKIGNKDYYLKYGGWGDGGIQRQTEYNLQIGVEYLAYQIYKLFGIRIPKDVQIVSDDEENRIGIATEKVEGKPGRKREPLRPDIRAKITNGMLVDMLLANWDIGNTSNLIIDDKDVARIDPGGSMIFRAQGERKSSFGPDVGELSTMHPLRGTTPAAKVYDASHLMAAIETFKKVSLEELISTINNAKITVVNGMQDAKIQQEIIDEWQDLVDNQIEPILKDRFKAIESSADFILKT